MLPETAPSPESTEKIAPAPRKVISIVTPCYNEELTIEDCHRAVQALFAGPLARFDYEHVIADNCSTDGTVEILCRLARENPRVKVILNSRNFGPFRSLYNALLATSGDGVVPFLPADLQDPPEVIVEFARLWEEGYEVVHGIRAERQENWLMKSVRRVYYRVVNALADVSIPVDVGEFQLIDRVVVDALRPVDDYYPYLRGLIASCGFRSTGVRYEWRERKKGLTKNRLYNLFDQGLNGIISFSNVPMRICLLAGLTLSVLSVLYSFYTVVVGLVFYRQLAPPGIPLLIAALFFFSGVQLFFLGVLGEYMSAVHSQVRKRPLVVERGRINFCGSPNVISPTGGLSRAETCSAPADKPPVAPGTVAVTFPAEPE